MSDFMPFYVRLPPELHARLVEHARSNDLTMAQVARRALENQMAGYGDAVTVLLRQRDEAEARVKQLACAGAQLADRLEDMRRFGWSGDFKYGWNETHIYALRDWAALHQATLEGDTP